MLLKVTLSAEELAAVDRLRGGVPRATWVRGVVRTAVSAVEALDAAVAAEEATPERVRATVASPAEADCSPLVTALGRPSEAAVSAKTGHGEGCGCLNCERARGLVS